MGESYDDDDAVLGLSLTLGSFRSRLEPEQSHKTALTASPGKAPETEASSEELEEKPTSEAHRGETICALNVV